MSRGVLSPNHVDHTVTLRAAEDVAEQTLKTMQSGVDSTWKDEPVFSAKLIQSRWEIKERIGSGGFGAIFKAFDTETRTDVAIKVEKRQCKCYLDKEVAFYATLEQARRAGSMRPAPRCHFSGTEGGYRIAVFDLMGESLSDLFYRCGRKFSLKTVLMLGQQLVSRLEAVHEAGIVHRDVKPGNFVMGQGSDASTVFVIDFGLSNMWRTSTGHIPFNMESPFRGTHRYASVNSHRKYEQSRRDDLEAIAYVLIYFINGGLPWQSLRVTRNKRRKAIGHSKAMITPEALCENLPHQFADFLKYVKMLHFDQTPDYDYCRSLFRNCFEEANFEDDGIWDWDLAPPRSAAVHPLSGVVGAMNASMLHHPQHMHHHNGLHHPHMSLNSSSTSNVYHPGLSMGNPYHHSNMTSPHMTHARGSDVPRAVMIHSPTSIRSSAASGAAAPAHPLNVPSSRSAASPARHSSTPHMTTRSNAATAMPRSVPRPCVNLASSMPMNAAAAAPGRPSSQPMLSHQHRTHLGAVSSPFATDFMSSHLGGSSASAGSATAASNAPTYASMLRSSNGSPMPADSIAYLDYCNSQTPQHSTSSQSLSNSSFLPTNTTSSASPNSSSATTLATAGGSNKLHHMSSMAPHRIHQHHHQQQPHHQHHMSPSSRTLKNNSRDLQASLMMNGMQSQENNLFAWNHAPTNSSVASSAGLHHSASSPMLGSTFESVTGPAASASSYANGSNFVSTHLLQLGQHPYHSHSHPQHATHYGNLMSVTVPSSPTNSLMHNGPSSPLLPESSPLLQLSTLLDDDTFFSNSSMPSFSTASSTASVPFSRALLTSSSSTVTAPVMIETSNSPILVSPVPMQQQETSSSVVATVGGNGIVVLVPDSPSSSTRPDSPMQGLDANLWVEPSASALIEAGIATGATVESMEDDVCSGVPFVSGHHLHHHHVISLEDGFSAEVAAAAAPSALVCVEQTFGSKKRARNMCASLAEPQSKRRSTRLLEKDISSAASRSGALQY